MVSWYTKTRWRSRPRPAISDSAVALNCQIHCCLNLNVFQFKTLLRKTRAGFNILFYCLESVEPSDVLASSLARLEYSEYSRYWTWMSGHPPLGLHFSVCQEFGSGKQNEFKFLSVFIWNTQPTPWALHKPINSLCFSSLLLVPCYNTVMRLRCCMRRGGRHFINWILEEQESRGRFNISLLS